MQFEKQLSRHRLRLAFAAHRGATSISLLPWSSPSSAAPAHAGPHVHSYRPVDLRRIDGGRAGEGRAIPTRPEPDKSWRVIPRAMASLSARLIGGFAACGEIAVSGFLLAFMSWAIAQVLAGCAAYAQAMYPCAIDDDPREQKEIPAAAPGEPVPPRRKERSGAAVPVGLSRRDVAQITRHGDRRE